MWQYTSTRATNTGSAYTSSSQSGETRTTVNSVAPGNTTSVTFTTAVSVTRSWTELAYDPNGSPASNSTQLQPYGLRQYFSQVQSNTTSTRVTPSVQTALTQYTAQTDVSTGGQSDFFTSTGSRRGTSLSGDSGSPTFTTSFAYSTSSLGGTVNTTLTWTLTYTREWVTSTTATSSMSRNADSTFQTVTFSTSQTSPSFSSWTQQGTTTAGATTYTYTVVSYLVNASGSTTSSSSSSTSGTAGNYSSRSYSYTTSTYTTTASNWTSTTATDSYSFPTTTAAGVTASTSTSFSKTTGTQLLSTVTSTSYATSTCQAPVNVDTVIEVGTNDWAWIASTATARGRVETVGASLASGTYTSTASIGSVATPTRIGYIDTTASTDVTGTLVSTTSQTNLTSSTTRTTSSSYLLASPTSVKDTLSLTGNTRTSSVTYLTSTGTTYFNLGTLTTSRTTTYGQVVSGLTGFSTSFTSTFTWPTTSTASDGTFPSSTTMTAISLYSLVRTSRTSSASGTFLAGSASSSQSGTLSVASVLSETWGSTYQFFNTGAPGTFTTSSTQTAPLTSYTYTVVDRIAEDGFQAGSSLGRTASASVGTNVSAGIALPMKYPCSSVYPGGPVTPVWATDQQAFGTLTTFGDSSTAWSVTTTATTVGTIPTTTTTALPVAFGTAGAVTESYSTARSTLTSFGGFGWDSSYTVKASQTSNALSSGTSIDSAGGSTSFTNQWTAANVISAPPGVAIAMESIPTVSGLTAATPPDERAGSNRLVASYSAFPSP